MSAASRSAARTYAPRAPRRVSGPVRRPVPVRAPAPPALARLRAIPDAPVLDRLLRSRAWIWMVGISLLGVVAMQVSLLKLNTGISRAVEASTTLQRQNSMLEGDVARLSSPERITEAAARRGLVQPEPGQVTWLHARLGRDAARAARVMVAPSDAARQALAAAATATATATPAGAATTGTPIAPGTQTTAPTAGTATAGTATAATATTATTTSLTP